MSRFAHSIHIQEAMKDFEGESDYILRLYIPSSWNPGLADATLSSDSWHSLIEFNPLCCMHQMANVAGSISQHNNIKFSNKSATTNDSLLS
jgi:hypothetical protein